MWYRNVWIDCEFSSAWYTISWRGEELIFSSLRQAKDFIDENEEWFND